MQSSFLFLIAKFYFVRFALALPKNGEYNGLINHMLGKMVESGELHNTRTKWAAQGKQPRERIRICTKYN